jgi:tripartite ATP-independent transporter DctP family solute receptor
MKYLLLLSAILIITLNSCNNDNNVKALKLAHSLNVDHPVHKAMAFMAEQAAKISGGKIRVDIYPGGQLGNERELIELLQIGSLAMTKVSAAPLEAFVPEMKIFGMPYVFRDDEHRWNILNSAIGKKMLLAGEPFFLRGLCYYDAGSRSFYTKEKMVSKPSDLKGLKIRVMKSQTSMEMVNTLGGSATPIPWGELYTALQQGVVDGAENNPPSFYFSKHYETCKYFSVDEHTSIPDILIMSTIVWNRLSEEEQQWLQSAVDKSVPYQRMLWKKASDEALAEVQKAGVEITYPNKAPFQKSVEKMYEKYKGSSVFTLIKKIRAIQ